MASILPMTLSGENLGERHRHLNLKVNKTVAEQVSFQDIESLPEETAVDRLFKIDLANKLKNVNYILKQLKDDDMLYVSRALKCKWLLERRDIINPKNLEDTLFPEMVMPAISKMRHWLYINLKEPSRCQEFYQYYKSTFEFALKFLCNCEDEFVLKEFPELLHKITPHYLKVFAEKNPVLIKIYFDSFATDTELVKRYLKNEKMFYNSIKCVLKSNPDVFLDIVEKYHNTNTFAKLSPTATDYILRYHKNRFMAKSELYVAHLLDMPTVARRLSVEECQEIVIRLARADYLGLWFSYANVETLVKRVGRDNRADFKKRVFVKKDVGERVVECPYEFPASPVCNASCDDPHVFSDQPFEPIPMVKSYGFRKMLIKRKYCAMSANCVFSSCPVKSELQKLFNEFRFMGFESTLYEMKARLSGASSADRRRDMLLVLVSKSGGRVESVRALMQLALRLRNEPVHQRATIVRSLVKRANAWRLPDDVWNMMLEYGIGLGLDGSKAEAECHEGLHAVVLRQLLTTGDCDTLVRTAFLDDFSTLSEYKLTVSERATISASLQRLLLTAASNTTELNVTATHLTRLLDVLEKYKINFGSLSVVSAIAELLKHDSILARPLLMRLYEARVGRCELLRQYLEFRHDDAALVNILRHDLKALEYDWFIKLLANGETRANQFLTKLVVYFNEKGGMAEKIRLAILDKINNESEVRLARPLATLLNGESLEVTLCEEDKIKCDGKHKFVAALRANMHRSRPAPDALALGWRKAGMKAVAGRAMRCRQAQVTQVLQALMKDGDKRTVRLTLALAQRTDCIVDIFAEAVVIRPLSAVRAALLYFRSHGNTADMKIWEIVKPFLNKLDLRPREGLRYILKKVKWVPEVLKPNYCAYIFLALDEIADEGAEYVRRHLMKYLPQVSENLLDAVLLRMLEKMDKENPESYPAIIIRYLMLSKNIQELKTRLEVIGEPFLEKIYACRDGDDQLKRNYFQKNIIQIAETLQYNHAFFDIKYQSCLTIIERVLKWIQTFLPKDIHFRQYVKIHATLVYFKAVRHSMKQKPETFSDVVKKMSEGVNIVGFTFGRYIVQEVAELKSKYFDSIVEIYSDSFIEYLDEYIVYGRSKCQFTGTIIKGMLAESVGTDTRLGLYVLKNSRYNLDDNMYYEIKELVAKKEDNAAQFFLYADIIE